MAPTRTGQQPSQPLPVPRCGDRARVLWLVTGFACLLASGWMLMPTVGAGAISSAFMLGDGSGALNVLGLFLLVAGFLLLVAGPLAGLALAATTLAVSDVRRAGRAALFALFTAGLLCGTAVEWFGWIRPAPG